MEKNKLEQLKEVLNNIKFNENDTYTDRLVLHKHTSDYYRYINDFNGELECHYNGGYLSIPEPYYVIHNILSFDSDNNLTSHIVDTVIENPELLNNSSIFDEIRKDIKTDIEIEIEEYKKDTDNGDISIINDYINGYIKDGQYYDWVQDNNYNDIKLLSDEINSINLNTIYYDDENDIESIMDKFEVATNLNNPKIKDKALEILDAIKEMNKTQNRGL